MRSADAGFRGGRERVMRYEGRLGAGRVLATELSRQPLGSCAVAGIPRGGIIVAGPIAERLDAPLTAVHARKLVSPLQPEFVCPVVAPDFGAVGDYYEDFRPVTDADVAPRLGPAASRAPTQGGRA